MQNKHIYYTTYLTGGSAGVLPRKTGQTFYMNNKTGFICITIMAAINRLWSTHITSDVFSTSAKTSGFSQKTSPTELSSVESYTEEDNIHNDLQNANWQVVKDIWK